jgi:dTDP-4-amino-4,6-dideoxygalactose transaminase
MEAIATLAREFGFRVIEDASHALGATYRGAPVGSCRYGDVTVMSFHPVKLITTGEGGMTLARDEEVAKRLARLRSHGISNDPALADGGWDGPWYYQQLDLGYNYRLTDLQAALGESQMRRLPDFLARRRALVRRYRNLLAELPVTLPPADADDESAWHLFVIRVAEERRRDVFDAMRAAQVMVNVHYIPVHLQPWYRRLGFRPGDFPQAEQYYREAITLPLHPRLSDADQDFVVATLAAALARP